jgi:hypothetical protein
VKCRVSRGGFSSERVFRVRLANGAEHVGAAPVDYFLTEQGERLSPDEPGQRGTQVAGWLVGRLVREEPGGNALVSVPSGEVLLLPGEAIRNGAAEGHARVPVQP